MPLPWMKMWLEALDDPKLTRLSLAERGAWWSLLQLAGKCDAGGKLLSGGQGLDAKEISDALHIKTNEDHQALDSMLAKMENRGSLSWNAKVLTVVHWQERQRIPPSAHPDRVADRVRRYREGKRRELALADPREAEKLSLMGIRYKERRKQLGRELSTEERLELSEEIEKELDKKYGQVAD